MMKLSRAMAFFLYKAHPDKQDSRVNKVSLESLVALDQKVS
jgi:hypothetical protein